MSAPKCFLLLVGSPRGKKSTSESLGNYLLEQLREMGLETEKIWIYQSLKSQEKSSDLISAVDRFDTVIFASPLYVDSLPAPVTKAIELIADHRKTTKMTKKQQLLAISNCGFPEAHHNDPALAIYRLFATESGFEWAGGLALGMGAAINGRSLNDLGSMARNVKKSLKLTATALAKGKPVSPEAVDLMAKQFIPSWIYMQIGGIGWRRQAKKNKVRTKSMYNRPYQR